jgi:hypothetical protein
MSSPISRGGRNAPEEAVGVFFFAAGMLLSLERICYAWIWRAPDAFRALCAGALVAEIDEPVDALRFLFYGFKVLQVSVFFLWCYVYGQGSLWRFDGGIASIALGGILVTAGQALNISVFRRLGNFGVFYGNKFGYHVPWCREFPFSLLEHPQYVGALLSIWGFFVIMRFPHADWYMLPTLETIYYAVGARFER